MYRYFKRVAAVSSGSYIYFSKAKGLSDKNIPPPVIPDYSFTPKLSYFSAKIRVEFKGNCLKQDKITYSHRTIVNIYILCFGAVILTINADID